VGALTRFVAVGAAERFLLCSLGISVGCKEAHRGLDKTHEFAGELSHSSYRSVFSGCCASGVACSHTDLRANDFMATPSTIVSTTVESRA
jgi:hypothetical protein